MELELASIRDTSPLADEMLVRLEQQHLVRAGLNELDERCRRILSMLYLQDRAASYLEVAETISVGETSISPLRTRCLKKLEKILSA
jgi:RNA polymerase sigma factor (sigma-70 family)